MSNNYQILINKLDTFIRKYYKNQLLKGVIYSLALLLGLFVVLTSLEYFAQFNQAGRTVLFYGFFAITAYILIIYVIKPLSKLYKMGTLISHKQAAEIIGNHFYEVKDKLINVLQLQEMTSANDNQLILAGIDQKSMDLKPIPFVDAVSLKDNLKYLKYIFIPVAIILFISLVSPDLFKESTERIINHNQEILPQAPFQIIVNNKKLTVLKNKDFELSVTIKGKQIPNKIYMVNNGLKIPFSKVDNTSYSYIFKNVQQSQKFSVEASGFSFDDFFLEVLPNPILTHFKISLDYPSYLEKIDETTNNTGDLVVPEGTILKWEITTEDADQFGFLIKDTTVFFKPVDGKVVIQQKAYDSFQYSFIPSNQNRIFGDTVQYSIQVIADQFPSIQLHEKQDSLNEKRRYFQGSIDDDYGFSRLTFNYQVLTKIDSLPNRNTITSIEMPFNKAVNSDEFFHFWNMADLSLLPGDEVSYYFEVWDNDAVNGRKSSKSGIKTIKLKTIEELENKTDETNQDIKDKLSEGINDAKQLQKDVENLRKKLAEKKEIEWQEKKKIQDLIEKQKELENKLEELNLENKMNNVQQNEFKQYNEEILQKQEQLQKLFDELMTDEMKELMKKLEEMMEKLDKNMLENELEKMDLSNHDLEKELDRSLELFKQMEFEQKLEEAKNKMEKLAEEQNKLAEETQNKKQDDNRLKEKQEDLNKKFEELKKDLNELKEKDEQLEKPKGFDEMKQKQEETSQEMKNSSDQIQNGKNKKASESQKKAAENMEQMAEELASMQSSSSDSGEDMDALRQLLDNLLHLSFEQENLMESFKTIKRDSPEYVKLAQQQNKLKEDAKMIEDSLFALSKRVVQLESTINKEISLINSNMAKAISFMEERQTPMATSRQQYVMTSINNLALMFDEALQQMQQQAQQKQGQGSCNNPGGKGQPKPGAGSVRQLQEQLNKQLDDLKKAMQEGKKPGQQKGQKPGDNIPGGQGGMSKSFAKMAAEQAKIRDQLQKMRNEMNPSGKRAADQLSKMMEETETDLVNKRITQETLNRQKEILTRLLESEKADRERELDDKRESNEGNDKTVSNPKLYFEYNKQKEQEVDLLKTTPPNLNGFYKKKVSKYFQNINE